MSIRDTFLYNIYYIFFHQLPRSIKFQIMCLGKNNSEKYNFKDLNLYKNIHEGERCFIVATAPSLNLSDLDMIKNEYSFGVNSIVNVFDKTAWRPTYYGVQDSGVEKVKNKILQHRSEIQEFFVGISPYKKLIPHFECQQVNYLLNILDHDKAGTKHILRTTKEADKFLYDGFSITFSMIELAMYMGFSEIVLLGVDCDYSGEKAHFDDYTTAKVPNASINMYQAFCQMREYAEENGVKIINASRGFKLKAFECKDLETVLSKTN